MSESYEFREVTHFTAGALGEPGQRVFYLQVGDERGHVSVRLEKQQVRALAQFLRTVLEDLPEPAGSNPEPIELIEPTVAEWVVGQIAVGVAEAEAEVVLVVDELVEEEEDDDEEDGDDLFESEPAGARIRAHINVVQAAQFIVTADELMTKGRPPCKLCGQPLDPTGHACPRLN
ncbi:MAG: DUF3090 family protein [Acidimicrobiia bacterium]|nr:DUF3090 family protein [Acidimicrobiia bacterium]